MRTVIELLHQSVRQYGSLPFLGQKFSDSYTTFSFARTDEASLELAAAFLGLGFKKGDNAAILSEGSAYWVIGEFAVLKAGCSSVPLSTKLSGDEVLFRLDHAECAAVLVSENNLPRILEVLDKAAERPLVVLLGSRGEAVLAAAAKAGLSDGKDFFFAEELLEKGKAALASDGALAGRLADIEAGISPDDTVTISYTSGTTGNPKGIMLTHRNYLHNATASSQIVKMRRGWKSLIMLPLDHSFAHTVGIYIFLIYGMCMYFVDARGGPMAGLRNLPKNLRETNPDILLTVPALSGNFMKKMVQGVAAKGAFVNGIFERGVRAGIARAGNGFAKPSLGVRLRAWFPWTLAKLLVFPKLRATFGKDIKYCIGGGALLEIKQQEFFNAIGVPVYQGYGLTENSPIICSNTPKRHKFGTSGVIIPTLEVKIMKDGATECAAGEKGQIVTRGDSVMKGYFKNPEASAETLRGGRLWSGDLGYIDADGFLVVTGREKALLIAADGEKYSPESIEEAIVNTSRFVNQLMAYNEQCRFTSLVLTVNAEALKAALPPGAGAAEVLALIKEDITAFKDHPDYASIPAQWRPSSFVLIAEPFDERWGLVNSTMKLVRHKVKERYADRIAEIYATGSADPAVPGNKAALAALGLPSA